ncbi:MAG: glycoside hydrolase N-terminal domain-containing protein [Prolixibacteraceae bacterium]|jgi:hypothetical protein
MNKRRFILLCILLITCVLTHAGDKFSSFEIAKTHPITKDRPVPGFFDGALLGNGGMGVVVTTRPDGVMLHFGHNNVWDIRIAEENKEKIGTFQGVFEKVAKIPGNLDWLTQDNWYNNYNQMTGENYSKPYPRPFPCGSVLIGFDRRDVELIGHKLDISDGLCEVYFLKGKEKLKLQLFTDMQYDKLWMRLVNENNQPHRTIFNRVRLIPDPSTPPEFPHFQSNEDLDRGELAFRQILPSQEPNIYDPIKGHPKDEAFKISVKLDSKLSKSTRLNWNGNTQEMAELEAAIDGTANFIACVSLEQGLNSEVNDVAVAVGEVSNPILQKMMASNIQVWKDYWQKSGVKLEDGFLEQMWYQNLYFFNCAVKEGVRTPGLFANWSYNNIGTSWHGDYHMNYNTQQPFWVTFSSNHLEKNLSYISLIEFLMPVSKKWAKEYYSLPGAYFPHSAYPVEMTMNPYPVPDWGWEICETPWAVQGLWWHYLYSGDHIYLRERAYGPIKSAVEFLVAYMNRPEARGGERWNDSDYHIFPTIPPELYGLRPGFKYNYDCSMDLTLTKFIFNAFKKAVEKLETQDTDAELVKAIDDILIHFPDYPTANSPKYGKVLVAVPEEHDQVVYNVPANLAAVFPGEDIGLENRNGQLKLAQNTYLNQQNEGGNDLVFSNLQAARLGILDLEKFKRQVNYCLLPNGTASDRVLQVNGRYNDLTDYGYMDPMGIWFENFALPAVINECLMQSYDGTIRLFPNWDKSKNASFQNLRAAGAFLVSAKLEKGKVVEVKVRSEIGSDLKIILPWAKGGTVGSLRNEEKATFQTLEMKTKPGETIVFHP